MRKVISNRPGFASFNFDRAITFLVPNVASQRTQSQGNSCQQQLLTGHDLLKTIDPSEDATTTYLRHHSRQHRCRIINTRIPQNAETDSPLRTHDGDAAGHGISTRHVSGHLGTVPTKEEARSHTSRHSSYRSRQQRDSSIVSSVPSVLSSAGAAMARAARKKVIIVRGRILVMC